MLKQEQYQPLKMYEQVIVLVVVLGHCLQSVPVTETKSVMNEILQHINKKHFDIAERIENKGILSDDDKAEIIAIANKYLQER